MTEPFADRLQNAIQKKNTRLCVGLDPHPAQLPQHLLSGVDTESMGNAIVAFNRDIIDATAPFAACFKPQVAFYERLGEAGWTAYRKTLEFCRDADVPVIADAKRGDIGSTAKAYSACHLGLDDGADTSAFIADALTVNAYLGIESLQPFLNACETSGRGLFALVKTSNPGGGQFQDLELKDGRKLYEAVADAIDEYNAAHAGTSGYGAFGAVVGATYPQELQDLRRRMPHTVFLVPGFGAQGGKAADVAAAFDGEGNGAVINSSRGIIFAYAKQGEDSRNFATAAEKAAREARDAINRALDG